MCLRYSWNAFSRGPCFGMLGFIQALMGTLRHRVTALAIKTLGKYPWKVLNHSFWSSS